jgi:hypothetical protein
MPCIYRGPIARMGVAITESVRARRGAALVSTMPVRASIPIPTASQIDFRKNDISGLLSEREGGKMVTAFRYLPDTLQAMTGERAPETLGGYFSDRTILRGPNRASADGPETGGDSIASAARAFGNDGQPGNQVFRHLSNQIDGLGKSMEMPQNLNITGALTLETFKREVGTTTPLVTQIETGRIFAYDGRDSGRSAFVDPASAMQQPYQESAGKFKELVASRELHDQAGQTNAPALSESKPKVVQS